MKKIQNDDVYESIGGVKLHRDDIDNIIAILTERSLKVSFFDSVNEYESIDEMLSMKGERPPEIKINGKFEKGFGSLNIRINHYNTILYAYNSAELKSLAYELHAYLQTKVPWHYNKFSPWLWGTPGYIFVISIGYIHQWIVGKFSLWVALLIPVIIAFWGISIIHRQLSYGLILRRIHEGGFWKRNVEKIVLLIFGSIIGTLITIIFQHLFSAN